MNEEKNGGNESRKPILASEVFTEIESYIQAQPKDKPRMPVLYVANYQAIRKFQIIELNKLTLLFGPNAAGKSIIADALEDLASTLAGENHIPDTRYHWGMLDSDSEDDLGFSADTMVLGVGGIRHGRWLTRDTPWSVDEKYSAINSEQRDWLTSDVVVCFQSIPVDYPGETSLPFYKRYSHFWLWRNGRHLARFGFNGQPPVIYADKPIKDYLDDDNSLVVADYWEGDDYREYMPVNEGRGKDDQYDVDGIFRHEVLTDARPAEWGKHHRGGLIYPPVLQENGYQVEKFIGNPKVAWSDRGDGHSLYIGDSFTPFMEDKEEDRGVIVVLTYLLQAYPQVVAYRLRQGSRLGPLRKIPGPKELMFNNIGSQTWRGSSGGKKQFQ